MGVVYDSGCSYRLWLMVNNVFAITPPTTAASCVLEGNLIGFCLHTQDR